jgi:hypothetical protein
MPQPDLIARGGASPAGRFRLTSRGWDGRRLGTRVFSNGTTDQGVTHVAARMFLGAAAYANWYVGLIDEAGFSALDEADTHQSHAGWAEWTGLYLSQRGLWVPTPASGRFMDAANTVLSITATGNVRGALLASSPTIGTASGQILYATGVDDDPLPVEAGGTVIVGYKLRFSPR